MKLYDFSIFAERKKERCAAKAVSEVIADLNSPGAVVVLKERVSKYLVLHQEIMRKAS